MRTSVLLGLFGIGLLLPPYGILLVPAYIAFWVLRPYTRPVVTVTGPKLRMIKATLALAPQ
jgi:hypothetical protein